ncbi:MAG: helix-turn-helix domain-containing protein [Gammaproteobacteria bacterium]
MKGSECRRGQTKALVRSTHNVPVRSRTPYWRDAVSTVFPSLSVDYRTAEPPCARLESRPFSDAQINQFIDNTHACHVVHTPSRSNWPEAYLLVLQRAGAGHYRHAGCDLTVEAGDLALLDMSRPFDLTFPDRHHELVWVLPRESLAPLLATPERVGIGFSSNAGPGALLASTLRTLADKADTFDAASQQILRIHVCNLAALTLGATTPVEEVRRSIYRLARRQQILAYVEAHLGESDLGAGKAAGDLNMSTRWLHALFSEDGTSFAAWVARRRIEECRRLLEDPRHDHLSISAIAFRCGFNDLSTFYRRFRAHCGLTPRDVRQGRPRADSGL